MKIKLVLDAGGVATAGVDQQALIENIQAELDKLATNASAKPAKREYKPAPPGAMGDMELIQWLIDIATDPEMARTYAKGLIFAINEILVAAKSSVTPSKGDKSGNKLSVRIIIFGKEIALPATISVIKAALKSLGDEQ